MKQILTLLLTILMFGCGEYSEKPATTDAQENQKHTPTNRVAIPLAVRENLGITFATVERRKLEDTLRAPGRFEYVPSAKREYRTMLSGQVELLVQQFEYVEEGTPLFQIDSPQWREIQQTIAGHQASVQQLEAKIEMFYPLLLAHEQHEYSAKLKVEMWKERLQKLEAIQEAGGGSQRELSAARAAHASALSELADVREKDAEFDATYAETVAGLRAATSTLEFELESAAALLNISNPMNDNWWKDVTAIEVNATNAGVVEHVDVTNGAWVVAKENILNVVQPEKLRFHALGLQSDLGVLRDGLQASIVPPTSSSSGNAIELQNTMHGTLQLGLTGDATDRTIDLYVTPEQLAPWARAGVTAQLEIVTSESGHSELSIPLSSVQQDGLTPIIFRRAPNNPDEVIRIEADLGINDGRWVAILSGVTDGDEVVLDGGFQLMLATSGTIQKGGHFHADGTFHEGDH